MMPRRRWVSIRSRFGYEMRLVKVTKPDYRQTHLQRGTPGMSAKGRTLFEWDARRAECQRQQGNIRRGIGVACFSYTSNTAGRRGDRRSPPAFEPDGTINVQSGATEIGQGRIPSSHRWWRRPSAYRSAMCTSFRPGIPISPHSTWRIRLSPKLCRRTGTAQSSNTTAR